MNPLKIPRKPKRAKISSEVFKMSTENSKLVRDAGGKKKMEEIPEDTDASDSPNDKSVVVKDPCTQIFRFSDIKSKNSGSAAARVKNLNLKFADVGSDEFADIEDNVIDSSESNESFNNVQAGVPSNRWMKESRDPVLPKSSIVEIQKTSSSSSETETALNEGELASENRSNCVKNESLGASRYKNDFKEEKTSSVGKTAEDGKRTIKFNMPTIEETAESEDRPDDIPESQPSQSRRNPLKMKAKVGNKKNKCNVCGVRLGLCAIKCRCGGYYCAKHRYDKEHNCSFDYKKMGAEEIRRNNPQVIAEKVRKL